jgi:hypothetical protein
LKVDVADSSARVVVSLTLGPAEMERILGRADRDGDGEVTSAEADAYLAEWVRALPEDLPVAIDGETVAVEWTEPFFDPVGPVGPVPGTVEAVGVLALAAGQHRITIHDRMRLEAFDRTDVAFRTRGTARLIASGAGDRPVDVRRDLFFGPDAEPASRILAAIVDVKGPEPESSASGSVSRWIEESPWIVIGGLVAALSVVLIAIARRRRRSDRVREGDREGRT